MSRNSRGCIGSRVSPSVGRSRTPSGSPRWSAGRAWSSSDGAGGASLVPGDIIDPLAEAGAGVCLAPPGADDEQSARAGAGIDALVLVGGADIDPRMCGGGSEGSRRDRAERTLLLAALERD